jgi:hypothetical protein
MHTNHPKAVLRIDLDRHIQKTAPNLLRLAIQPERNVGAGLARDDRKTADQRQCRSSSGPATYSESPYASPAAASRVLKSLKRSGDPFRRPPECLVGFL